MSATNIEFVYFDLGNVLVAFDPQQACANVAQRWGVPIPKARQAIYDSGLQNRFERGEVSGEEFAETLRRDLAPRGEWTTADVLDAVSAMFTPVESMRDTVQQVRQRNLPVGILSNTCVAHWDWIMRQQYAVMGGEFQVTVLSFQVGSMKPDAGIYEAAEKAAGVPGDRILFLDDKAENVQAARQRGWLAEQCLGGELAELALRDHGVIAAVPRS